MRHVHLAGQQRKDCIVCSKPKTATLTPEELGRFADYAAERIAVSGHDDAEDPDPAFVLEVAVEVAREHYPDADPDDLSRQLREWVY